MIAGINSASFAEEELFDTKTAGAHLEKGIAQIRAKNYTAAVNELEESVSIYPDAESFYYLGYAYYMKGRAGDSESRKSSIENFDKAYELDPNFTPNKYKPEQASAVRKQAISASSTTAETNASSGESEPVLEQHKQ